MKIIQEYEKIIEEAKRKLITEQFKCKTTKYEDSDCFIFYHLNSSYSAIVCRTEEHSILFCKLMNIENIFQNDGTTWKDNLWKSELNISGCIFYLPKKGKYAFNKSCLNSTTDVYEITEFLK